MRTIIDHASLISFVALTIAGFVILFNGDTLTEVSLGIVILVLASVDLTLGEILRTIRGGR